MGGEPQAAHRDKVNDAFWMQNKKEVSAMMTENQAALLRLHARTAGCVLLARDLRGLLRKLKAMLARPIRARSPGV